VASIPYSPISHLKTTPTWLCRIPANKTPEMIDPFLVSRAEGDRQGSVPAVPGFQGNRPWSRTRMRCRCYKRDRKNLEGEQRRYTSWPSRSGESGKSLDSTVQLSRWAASRDMHAGCDSLGEWRHYALPPLHPALTVDRPCPHRAGLPGRGHSPKVQQISLCTNTRLLNH
jgi:hypothetical protein